MARKKISKTGVSSTARSRVTLNPKLARRSFLKLSAATAALSGAAMTAKMTGKANAAQAANDMYPDSDRWYARSAPTARWAVELTPR
jgi:hypothetical protein